VHVSWLGKCLAFSSLSNFWDDPAICVEQLLLLLNRERYEEEEDEDFSKSFHQSFDKHAIAKR
jgi:hypothetical protein